jgi:hypothetical protein
MGATDRRIGGEGRGRVWLTGRVPRERAPLDPERQKRQRQFIRFAWVATAIVLLLAWMQLQHGTVRTVGVIISLPVIAVLLVVTFRWGQAIKRL